MKSKVLIAAIATLGFAACDAPPDGVEAQDQNLTNQGAPFVNAHRASAVWTTPTDLYGNPIGYYGFWYKCADNEVMVGIHMSQGYVTCASLNGVTLSSRFVDFAGTTAVPWNYNPTAPYMHGCPPYTWMQGFLKEGSREDILCVGLKNGSGVAQQASNQYVDYNGGYGSQSTYNISPNMHVCKPGPAGGVYGMVGIHQARNDLFCAN
jgi:hypothetical protein